MAAQEETDSLADSQKDDGDDETANDEQSEGHVSNGTVVCTQGGDVEMTGVVDIAGHDETSVCGDDPLLKPNQEGRSWTKAGALLLDNSIDTKPNTDSKFT